MVANRVRYVVRLCKRRDCNERHSDPELVEAGAFPGISSCRVSRERWAEGNCVVDAAIRWVHEVGPAFRTCS